MPSLYSLVTGEIVVTMWGRDCEREVVVSLLSMTRARTRSLEIASAHSGMNLLEDEKGNQILNSTLKLLIETALFHKRQSVMNYKIFGIILICNAVYSDYEHLTFYFGGYGAQKDDEK